MERSYEVLYITRPDIEEEEYGEVVKKFEKAVQDEGGTVTNIEEWNIRPFAYEIEHYDRGYYVLMTFSGEQGLISSLNQRFKLDDRVLRHQTIRREEDVPTSGQTAGTTA